jgi:fatty acid CoA ligase FadD36
MTLLPALHGAFGDRAGAVRVGDEACSWSELAARAAATAAELSGMPAVAVAAQPSLDTIVAVVAALAAGVPFVPVPADAGPDERAHALRDSGAVAFAGACPWDGTGLPAIPVARVAGGEGATRSHPPEPPASAAAMIMYTSGTTGMPKGVIISRAAVAAGLDSLAEAWDWTPDDTLVHGLPLFHVHGLVLGVLGALHVGSSLVHTVRPTPAAYAAAGGTLCFGVPTVWSRIVAEPVHARALQGARLLVSGSAALPEPVFNGIEELCGQRPIERYGMTETLITVSTRAAGERRRGSVGLPLTGVKTRVVDDHGTVLPHDGESVGALEVQTPTLFDGYLHRPDDTARSYTADGWFRTGDAATVAPDGFHRIVGRQSTDLIKTGGFRVGAGEVEGALLAHPAVREAAVIGVPDADLGQRIVAFVVGDGLAGIDLSGFVAERLSVHKRPRRVHVVDELPRNAMGKVQKTKLVEP